MTSKASRHVTFSDHPTKSYMDRIDFDKDRDMFRYLAQTVPGFRSNSTLGIGTCEGPIEMRVAIAEIFRGCGYVVVHSCSAPKDSKTSVLPMKVGFPHQREGARRILQHKVYFLPFEMGTGKTLTTILALRAARPEKTLIVCPAGVKSVWEAELKKWWPRGRPTVVRLETGKDCREFDPHSVATPEMIILVSYNLVGKLQPIEWDFLVGDEFHYVADNRRRRSEAVRSLFRYARAPYKVALTGTPITNDVKGIWHQLDCLWPNRFGTFWDFVRRYAIVEETEYTKWHIHGLNMLHAAELSERLAACSYRVTCNEVGHIMPSFSTHTIRVAAKSEKKSRAALEEFARTGKISEACLAQFAPKKIEMAIEFIESRVGIGKRVVALTHLHDTGDTLAARLEKKKFPVWHFDGRQSGKVRDKIVQTALREPKAGVLVCTMHSVKEGRNDLAGFDAAIFVELYSTPGIMAQAVKRFRRLSGACDVWIPYIEGSHEELVAERLRAKIDDVGCVLRKGEAETKLSNSLGRDDVEELEDLRKAALEMLDENFSTEDCND